MDRYLAISLILCQISPRPSEVIFVSILLAWRIARVFKTTDESVKEARARFSGTWRAGRLLRREQCEHNVWNTLNKKRAGGWDEQRSPPANTCQPTKCFFTVISNSVPSTSCLSKDPLYPHKYNSRGRGRVKLSQMNTKY